MAQLLALVPSTASEGLAAVIYVHVGALSVRFNIHRFLLRCAHDVPQVIMWDIICHLKQDYRLLYTDFCVKTFMYYLCRSEDRLNRAAI